MQELRAKLASIERSLDAGGYRPGTWQTFVRRVQNRPRSERVALAAGISRVSQKLHRRTGRRTLPVAVAVALELAATALGAVLLAVGLRSRSSTAVLGAAAVWVVTFEPLLKLLVGTVLGVRYDYAYLRGIEPRFKMRYGTYVAAARAGRIVLHLSGTIGSPLAAWLVRRLVGPTLVAAAAVCGVTFWALVALNGALFVAGLAGVRRIGGIPVGVSSGGAAAVEIRQALLKRRA
ncbi:MAG: hypothetical protein ACE5I7_00885 [Candidatus Binatia bacterium]